MQGWVLCFYFSTAGHGIANEFEGEGRRTALTISRSSDTIGSEQRTDCSAEKAAASFYPGWGERGMIRNLPGKFNPGGDIMGPDLLKVHEVICRTISAVCGIIAAVNIIFTWRKKK